jgi:hypothetical protein
MVEKAMTMDFVAAVKYVVSQKARKALPNVLPYLETCSMCTLAYVHLKRLMIYPVKVQ